MSVYSIVTSSQIKLFFSDYPLGEVLDFQGIQDGIDNTNYFVTTSKGEFVLTLFETLIPKDLPHYLKLMLHLGNNNLPCPCPQQDNFSNPMRLLNNKQAAVFTRLPGKAVVAPTVVQCREIGLHLGRLHDHTQHYSFPFPSNHDLQWCKSMFSKIESHLTASDCTLMKDELLFQTQHYTDLLPKGVIHGDLFRDNVLFVDGKLNGLLDFYSAGEGCLLLDIAITANDWCQQSGKVDVDKMTALLSGYESVRPLTASEKQCWPTQLRAAALRYWLSRLAHQYYPRSGAITQQKDPLIFRQLLLQYRQKHIFD